MWKIIPFIHLFFFNLFIIYRNNLNRYLLYGLKIDEKKIRPKCKQLADIKLPLNAAMTNVHDSYKLVKNERKRSG